MPAKNLIALACLLILLAACARAPQPMPPAAPAASSALALSPNGSRLAAVNPDSDSITLVDANAHTVIAEVMVGDNPATAAFAPDGALLLVTNRGAGTLSIIDVASARATQTLTVGLQPYGVVADEQRAYISLFAENAIAVLDLETLTIAQRLAVDSFPAGLAVSDQSVYVSHFYSGRVTRLSRATLAATAVLDTHAQANLSQAIALSPDGSRAYLPQTFSNADNLELSYDTTAFPMVSLVDLRAFTATAPLNLAQADQPVAIPFAVAVSPDGQLLYVANAASDDVSVINLTTGQAAAHYAVGHHPRGLALSPDGSTLFINNALDGSLSIFNLQSSNPPITLTLTTISLDSQILLGQRLFNSALPPLAEDHWLACSSCHFDGGHDARTWLGFPDGPRNTPALFGTAQTLPAHWSGDLDELQDTELTIRNIQHGLGLIEGEVTKTDPANAGRSVELDALAAYLNTLAVPAPPVTLAADALDRAERAFRRWGCSACHTAPLYTDLKLHDTPIGDPTVERNPRGQFFDTPSLLGVWATAPYFHDGSAATLRDTLFSKGFHSMGYAMNPDEVEDIVAFMQSLR